MTRTATIIALGEKLRLRLEDLLESKLFICTNSGGGKTHASRLLIEAVAEKIPTIVIDPSGEYSTLREKYDFVLVGEGGEIALSVKSAAKLARFLVEKRCNAIIDLHTMSRPEQELWIAAFFGAINGLPRSCWGATLFIIDEIHRYAPEKSHPPSRDPLVTLFDSGRLKGFCGVAVSQRQAKVAVDIRQECNNILQGRAIAPAELRAAGDLIGLAGKREDLAIFKRLKIGEFLCSGPAMEHEGLLQARTFEHTKTTHLSSRNRQKFEPPAPRKRILGVADELNRMLSGPDVIDVDVASSKELRARVRTLEAELKKAKATPVPVAKTPLAAQTAVSSKEIEKRMAAARASGFSEAMALLEPFSAALVNLQATLSKISEGAAGADAYLTKAVRALKELAKRKPKGSQAHEIAASTAAPVRRQTPPRPISAVARRQIGEGSGDPTLGGGGERRMLVALAQHPEGLHRKQLGLYADVAYKGGSFSTYLSKLRVNGWIEDTGDRFVITDAGLTALGSYDPLPSGQALIDYWIDKVGRGSGAGRMLEVLLEAGEDGLDRDELSERSNVALKGGSFSTYLSTLNSRMLIAYSRGGPIRAAQFLLDAAAE